MELSRPGTLNVASKGLFQYLADCARVGCTVPSSSVQRDMMTQSFTSHFHVRPKRVCATLYTGDRSSASRQLWPPSVEISTLRIAPAPDHARPLIW